MRVSRSSIPRDTFPIGDAAKALDVAHAGHGMIRRGRRL